MEGDKRFNIRVYGIWIAGDKILVNDEVIKGRQVIKFPGGGLEFGEGTIDCLKREWKEELDIDIEIKEHFYTTDYFQPSAFGDSQVISIYYLVSVPNPPGVIVNTMPEEKTYWMDLMEISADTFTLAIDKVVGGMIYEKMRELPY